MADKTDITDKVEEAVMTENKKKSDKAEKTIKAEKAATTDKAEKTIKIEKATTTDKVEKTVKTKTKRLSKGQRKHVRRMKQVARKEGVPYRPGI